MFINRFKQKRLISDHFGTGHLSIRLNLGTFFAKPNQNIFNNPKPIKNKSGLFIFEGIKYSLH